MLTFYFVIFAVSLGISISVMPLLKRLAFKYKTMLDIPNERNIHVKTIPRNGGIGIALASFIAILLGVAMRPGVFGENFLHLIGIILGGVLILLLGICDDIRGMNHRQKFIGQTFAAIILIIFGVRFDAINIPFGHIVHLPLLFSISLTIFWVLAVTNALNLIDGMDGLAGGIASIASAILFILALIYGKVSMAIITISLIGGCLGFLRYNYPPAKIFMGDCGSMFLGFTLAAVSINSSYKNSTAVSILIPITILSLPLLDTTLAIVRRLWRRKSPFCADKEHIHHQLLNLGLSTKSAIVILYLFCVFCGVVALIETTVSDAILAIFITFAGAILITPLILLPKFNNKYNGYVKGKRFAKSGPIFPCNNQVNSEDLKNQ